MPDTRKDDGTAEQPSEEAMLLEGLNLGFDEEEDGGESNADTSATTEDEVPKQQAEGTEGKPTGDQDRSSGAQDAGDGQKGQPGAPDGQEAANLTAYSADPRLRQDQKGNLVSPDGRVVVPAGMPRRLYEEKLRLTRTNGSLKEENDRLTMELANAQVAAQIPQELGISSEEARTGMQLVASFKKDPVATLKYILNEAAAQGYTVEGAGVDTGAIKRAIEEQLAPLTREREQQAAQQKHIEEAQREIETFYNDFPDASIHEAEMARLLQQDDRLSLRDAYYELKLYATRQGLDFSQPLRPQLLAKMQNGQDGQGGQQGTAAGQSSNGKGAKPMMSGTADARGAGGSTPARDSAEVYDDPSSDWGAIVRRALADASSN